MNPNSDRRMRKPKRAFVGAAGAAAGKALVEDVGSVTMTSRVRANVCAGTVAPFATLKVMVAGMKSKKALDGA